MVVKINEIFYDEEVEGINRKVAVDQCSHLPPIRGINMYIEDYLLVSVY